MLRKIGFSGRASVLRFAYVAMLIAAIPLLGPVSKAQAASDGVEALTAFDTSSAVTVDNTVWARLLSDYVVAGGDGIHRFRYADVSAADKTALKQYLASLQAFNPASLNRDEQFAYWVNLYNAATVDLVLDHYPVDTIRAIRLSGPLVRGPWRKEILRVSGYDLSLDTIEHEILREKWSDPRVHYAVNCASIGCPNLAMIPYTGAALDAQLTAAARAYVNHPRGTEVKDGKLIVSSIYDWFKEDFGNTDAGVIAHLKEYAGPQLKEALSSIDRISKDRYDWALNDASG